MTRRERRLFWLVALAASIVLLFVLRDVLLPFVAGMAVAYFLDPVVDRCVAARLARGWATLLVLVLFFLLASGIGLLLFLVIQNQMAGFLLALPGYIERAEAALALLRQTVPLIDQIRDGLGQDGMERLPALAGQFIAWLPRLALRLVSGGLAIANIVSLLVITPIVAFYLLRDWDLMVARIDDWLPRRQAAMIREQARAIDRTLAAFVRGQGLVCLVLGGFYGLGLSLSGLQFGLAIGLFAGLISFVPFVGAVLGGVLSVGLAALQFDSWQPVAVVAAIFVAGQIVEGNVLTPKLVGDAVGLHPVWIIFALLAGGSLFGFLGVLLAVPAVAVLGVLTRFALDRYLASPLHLEGIPPPDDVPAGDAPDSNPPPGGPGQDGGG